MSNLEHAINSAKTVHRGIGEAIQSCGGLVEVCARTTVRLQAAGFHKAVAKLETVTETAHRETEQLAGAQTDAVDAVELLVAVDTTNLDNSVVSLARAVQQLNLLHAKVSAVFRNVVGLTSLVGSLGAPGRPVMDLVHQIKTSSTACCLRKPSSSTTCDRR